MNTITELWEQDFFHSSLQKGTCHSTLMSNIWVIKIKKTNNLNEYLIKTEYKIHIMFLSNYILAITGRNSDICKYKADFLANFILKK